MGEALLIKNLRYNGRMSNDVLLEIEDLAAGYGARRVFAGVSLALRRGETLVVAGANGSGKSTLLGLIAGTVWPAPERGLRRYDFGFGEETDAVRARDELVLVGHELQDRYALRDWNFTALEVVLSGIYRTDVPRRKPAAGQRERALDVLRRLGVEQLAERRFLELSRGEQRRVLIARGVAFGPSVLLLDEPASGLDARARVELDAMLELVARECTLVCAAHRPEELPAAITRCLFIEGGRVQSAPAGVRKDIEQEAAVAVHCVCRAPFRALPARRQAKPGAEDVDAGVEQPCPLGAQHPRSAASRRRVSTPRRVPNSVHSASKNCAARAGRPAFCQCTA